MPDLLFNLPKLSTAKKPVLKQKELTQLLSMQLAERTPLLELINPYLQALNRYKMAADKRLGLIEKVLPHTFSSLLIIKQQYLAASIPEPFNQKTALNTALETCRQLIFAFKRALQDEADRLKINRKQLALYSFRIMELLYLQQWLHALRYQTLANSNWEELHQVFFIAHKYTNIADIQEPLSQLHSAKSAQSEIEHSIQQYYIHLQLFAFMDIQSWQGKQMFLVERYINKEPLLEFGEIPGRTSETLTIYPGLSGPADKFHENLPKKEVLYLDLKSLIQRLLTDQQQLKKLTDDAPTPRRPVTVSRLTPSLATFLINKMLSRLQSQQRKQHRDFLIGTDSAELYTGMSECLQQLNPQPASEFDRFAPEQTAIEDWKIIEDTPNSIRLQSRENNTTPTLQIGLPVCYKSSAQKNITQLAKIDRIIKTSDKEIEISLKKLAQKSETVVIREVDPDLKEQQWLVNAILTEEDKQDLLYLEHGTTLPADIPLLINRPTNKVPFTLQQHYTTWQHHDIYKITLHLDDMHDIASAIAQPVLEANEYVFIPNVEEEIELTLPTFDDEEQEFTLTTDLTDHTEQSSQWTTGDIAYERYQILALLEDHNNRKRYHAKHLCWNMDIIIELFDHAVSEPPPDLCQNWCQLGVHPHIVSCYYALPDDKQTLLISAYPIGQPLYKSIIHQQINNPEQAIDIAIQTAWALQHAHQQNICHPCYRPENIWLEANDDCHVGQFIQQSEFDHIYDAPEQTTAQITPAMNIYAWALIVLQLFTSKVTWRPQHPPQWNTDQFCLDMPPALLSLLQQCLNIDPSQRPDITTIITTLPPLYQEISGIEYLRPTPQHDKNGSQNNKALAQLDLTQPKTAQELWLNNLETNAEDTISAYNLALFQWREAITTDYDTLATLQQLQADNSHWLYDYLQGHVHVERGDYTKASEILESTLPLPHVKTLLNYALDHQDQTRQHHHQYQAPSIITALDMQNHSDLVLSGHDDGQIRLWQFHNWHLEQTLPLHEHPVNAVSLSFDEQLALSSDDNDLLLWATNTGQILYSHPQPGILCIQFSHDQQYFAVGGQDKNCRIWETERHQVILNLSGHRGIIHAICFSPDNRYFASASDDCTLKVWDISTGRCIQTLRGHTDAVTAVQFLPQAQLLSASADGTLRRWQQDSGKCSHVYNGHEGRITAISLTQNSRFALSTSEDTTLRLWDLDNHRCLHTFVNDPPQLFTKLTGNGEQALSADHNAFQHWEIHAEEDSLPAPMLVAPIQPHHFYAQAVDQFEKATQKAQMSIENRLYKKSFQLLQIARQQYCYEKDPDALNLWTELYAHLPRVYLKDSWQYCHFELQQGNVNSACISHKSQYLLAGSQAGILQLWELITEQRRCLKTIEAHEGAINVVCLSTDDQYALTGGDDHCCKLWDLTQTDALQTLTGHQSAVTSVAFLKHNQYCLSGSKDHTIKLWHLETGQCIHTYQGHHNQINDLALSPDDRFFLSASGSQQGYQDNSLRLWDIANGECLRTFEGHEAAINAICFSPDGQSAYSASDDAAIRKWSIYSGECQKIIQRHHAEVTSLQISMDGQHMLSSDSECQLYLWETESTQIVHQFTGHYKHINVASLSTDNHYLLSADRSNKVLLWFMDWQLQFPPTQDWDWAVMPWLIAFFNRHVPHTDNLQQQGEPDWSMQHFEQLCQQLGHAGYGWIEPKTIWQQLNTISEHWQHPINLFEHTETCPNCQASHQPPPTCLNCGTTLSSKHSQQDLLQQIYDALDQRQYDTVLETAQTLHERPDFRHTTTSTSLWGDLYNHFPRSYFNDSWKSATFRLQQGSATAARLSRRNHYLLAGTDNGLIQAWELVTNEHRCIQTIETQQGVIHSICIDHDDQQVLSAGEDSSIKLWDLRQGKLLQTFNGHQATVTQILFLRHAGFIVSASEDMSIRLWSTESGECIKILQGHNNKINALDISIDDRYLLSGSGDDLGYRDNSLKLWDLTTGDCLRTFEEHEQPVQSVSISPDASFVYSGGRDGLLKQWSIYDGQCTQTFSAHTDAILSMSLSMDGSHILSGSRDNSARLWEIESGDCIYHFTGHTHRIHDVHLSNDLRYALTAGDDSHLQLWYLDWELELPDEFWSWQIMPWVIAFLNRHMPTDTDTFEQQGQPQWDSSEFKQLYIDLGFAGYGWVEPKRLWQYLEQYAQYWQRAQCLLDMAMNCPHCGAEHQVPPKCLACEQDIELDAIQCPECDYCREETDTSPNWQCPRCGLDYAG